MTVGSRSEKTAPRWTAAAIALSAISRMTTIGGTRRMSVEFDSRRGLRDAHRPHSNHRLRVILSFDRTARQPPKHRELARVGERICDRALEQPFDRPLERLV